MMGFPSKPYCSQCDRWVSKLLEAEKVAADLQAENVKLRKLLDEAEYWIKKHESGV